MVPSNGRIARPAAIGLVAFVVILMAVPTGLAGSVGPGTGSSPSGILPATAATATYNETVRAPDLSPGETFSFDFDGVLHSAPGGGSVRIAGIAAGAHSITNITATPVASGWAYFGHADPGSPILVPGQPTVNLSFSLLDLSTPVAPIHFHAVHLLLGTRWALEVNGTTETSATLWINTTSRLGSIPVQAESTVDFRGTTRYDAPPGDPALAVTPNSTSSVSFTVRYLVQVYGSVGGFVLPNGSSWYSSGENLTIRATGYEGYAFGSWNGSGIGSYSGVEPRHTFSVGGPEIETATFWPIGVNRDVIRVNQEGVPTGTVWTVYVNGGGFSSATTALVVPNVFPCGPTGPGMYNISIPPAYGNSSDPLLGERYVPGPYPLAVCGGAVLNMTFFPQSMISFRSSPGGAATASNSSGSLPTGAWVPNGTSVTFQATAAPGYSFTGWVSNGSSVPGATTSIVGVTVVSPVEEVAEFAPLGATVQPTYPTTFALGVPLPTGTTWSIELNDTSYASSLPNLTVPALPAGTYEVSPAEVATPDGMTELEPTPLTLTVTVPAAGPVLVSFATFYRVEVWSGAGGSATANLSWALSGSTVAFLATPATGNTFVGWAGVGVGNYSGPASTVTVQVEGPWSSPRHSSPPRPRPTPGTGSSWQRPEA